MNDTWTDRWNERYSQETFAYGKQPNNYLKEQLEKLNTGTILFAQKVKDAMQFLQLNVAGPFQRLTSVYKEKIKPFNLPKPTT